MDKQEHERRRIGSFQQQWIMKEEKDKNSVKFKELKDVWRDFKSCLGSNVF